MKELNLVLIKQRRKEFRISLLEMAVLLGFKNASTYYKYEIGQSRFKAEHIPIVASKLKLKMNEIFFTQEIAKLAN
jgi:transcriptional regulator with XRE-family HTH domain